MNEVEDTVDTPAPVTTDRSQARGEVTTDSSQVKGTATTTDKEN